MNKVIKITVDFSDCTQEEAEAWIMARVQPGAIVEWNRLTAMIPWGQTLYSQQLATANQRISNLEQDLEDVEAYKLHLEQLRTLI